MFPLNYVSPKSGRAVKKETCSLDNNLSLTSVYWMHVASNGILDCNWQSHSSLLSPNHKALFHAEGGDMGAYALWQNYCSSHLSIFIIVQPPHPLPSLEGMIHDTLTLSLIRATTCSSQWLFTGIGFVSSKSRRGEEGEGEEGWQAASKRAIDGWKRGELTGESEAD